MERNKSKFIIVLLVVVVFISIGGVFYFMLKALPDASTNETPKQRLDLSADVFHHELGTQFPEWKNFVLERENRDNVNITLDPNLDENTIGEYLIEFEKQTLGTIYYGELKVIVQDTTPPEFTLKNVVADDTDIVSPNNFIKDFYDLQEVTFEFKNQIDTKNYGLQTVTIVGKDKSGNMLEKETTILINETKKPVASTETNSPSNTGGSSSGSNGGNNNSNSSGGNSSPSGNANSGSNPSHSKPSISGTTKSFPIENYNNDFDLSLSACRTERSTQMNNGVNKTGVCSPYQNEKGHDVGYKLTWE